MMINKKNIVTALKAVSWGLTAAIVILAFMLVGVRIFGVQVFTVLSGSMEPELPIGSLIYVKETDPSLLEIGDVITYRLSGDTVATHRIVDKALPDSEISSEISFITKGDANENPDNLAVSEHRIIGKVVTKIPRMGYIASYIQSRSGAIMSISIGVAIFFFMALVEHLDKEINGEKQKTNKQNRKTIQEWFK